MKKILLALAIPSLFAATTYSQVFEFEHDVMSAHTEGFDDEYEYVELTNYVKNVATYSIDFDWRIVNLPSMPSGFKIIGFCDNVDCYTGTAIGEPHVSDAVSVGEKSLFRLDMNVQKSAPNTTFDLEVEVKSGEQIDTVIYRINKTPTGITMVPVNDLSVNLYPNPVHGGQFSLYIAPEYKATTIAIHNIMGQQVAAHDVTNEVEHINVNDLPAGMYMVQVADVNNQVIALRKFVKK